MGSSPAAVASLPRLTAVATLLVLLVGQQQQQQASGLSTYRQLRAVVDRLNERHGPFLAMVMAYSVEADALQTSGEFVANAAVPFVDMFGRRFHVGTIRRVSVVTVMSGQRRLNAGITVQILMDYFDLGGIVHYGTAGSADDSLSFGAVSVPKYVAFTGSWNWKRFNSIGVDDFPELSVGYYNTPKRGENLLGRIEFKPEEFFPVGGSLEEVFWLEPFSAWYQLAQKLEDVVLDYCVNSTYCLPSRPKVVLGLRGATADIFLGNAAYRRFLHNEFNVSTVDEESAAIVM
ncbi:hypothetical protein Taro_027333, partial [Colocasia esculenta]|nr:hypothetical protein [Colocasia esculenta]